MTKRVLRSSFLVLGCAAAALIAWLAPLQSAEIGGTAPSAILGFGGRVAINSDGSIQMQTASGQPIQAYGSSAGFYSGPVVFGSLVSPAVAASGQANLYFDGTALKLSTNGGGYITLGAPDLSNVTITGGTIAGVTIGPINAPSDVLELRRSSTQQEMRLYETYTDGSNHTHLKFYCRPGSNDFYIGADYAGTGSQRGVSIFSALAFNGIQCASSTANIGIQFTTAQAARWRINQSGHFLAEVDNVHDIGASGANRPRAIYVGSGGVILPTADPHIAGALWNNAGSPAISAGP